MDEEKKLRKINQYFLYQRFAASVVSTCGGIRPPCVQIVHFHFLLLLAPIFNLLFVCMTLITISFQTSGLETWLGAYKRATLSQVHDLVHNHEADPLTYDMN